MAALEDQGLALEGRDLALEASAVRSALALEDHSDLDMASGHLATAFPWAWRED